MKDEENSLVRDLVDPVKSFASEVHKDAIVDAKNFYVGQAKRMKKNAEAAKAEAARKREALRREQEELKKHRQVMMKRAFFVVAGLIAVGGIIISFILNHGV